jgi:tartrate dehydrogenase/decarboxylase / D-malate dehydrogenase
LTAEPRGEQTQPARLQKAVDATTGSGVLTRDVGSTATTDEVVATVIENLVL